MIILKNSFRRNIIKASLGVAAIAGISTFGLVSVASADKYPNKPIELVIQVWVQFFPIGARQDLA